MVAANLVNVALNWLLIGGNLGAPALGAPGAALASTLARLVMAVGLVLWLLALPEFASWRAPASASGGRRLGGGAEMRRIGLAGGELLLRDLRLRLARAGRGLLGATPLAAYTVLHNVEGMVFMIALGMSVATAVRVGQAAGPARSARRAPPRSPGLPPPWGSSPCSACSCSASRRRWSPSTAPTPA